MTRWRPWLEIPGLLLAALACAWISNRFAGPTRRLSWLPERVAAVAPARPPSAAPVVAPAPAHPALVPASRPKPRPEAPPAPPPAWDPAGLLARFPPLQGQAYAEISSDEARWLHGHGALFADARRTNAYGEGHIPGALSLPVWEDGLPQRIAALGAKAMGTDLPLVVYCAGGECEDSKLLAQKLWLAGYRNLRVYTGGFPEWASRGWPVRKGATP
jgi:rhodanese-related sulfurtransferase